MSRCRGPECRNRKPAGAPFARRDTGTALAPHHVSEDLAWSYAGQLVSVTRPRPTRTPVSVNRTRSEKRRHQAASPPSTLRRRPRRQPRGGWTTRPHEPALSWIVLKQAMERTGSYAGRLFQASRGPTCGRCQLHLGATLGEAPGGGLSAGSSCRCLGPPVTTMNPPLEGRSSTASRWDGSRVTSFPPLPHWRPECRWSAIGRTLGFWRQQLHKLAAPPCCSRHRRARRRPHPTIPFDHRSVDLPRRHAMASVEPVGLARPSPLTADGRARLVEQETVTSLVGRLSRARGRTAARTRARIVRRGALAFWAIAVCGSKPDASDSPQQASKGRDLHNVNRLVAVALANLDRRGAGSGQAPEGE